MPMWRPPSWLVLLALGTTAGCARNLAPVPSESAGAKPSAPAPSPAPGELPPATLDAALQLRARGQQTQGLRVLERVFVHASEAQDVATAAMALHRQGDLTLDLLRCAEAGRLYKRALMLHEARGDLAMAGLAANDLGLWSRRCGRPLREPIAWFTLATERRRAAGDLPGVRVSANNLGSTYFNLRMTEEGNRAFLEALAAAEAIHDASAERQVHANLALLWTLAAEHHADWTDGEPPPPVSPDSPAERTAREHFAQALEAARRAQEPESAVCATFGRFSNRCDRLAPRAQREP
ncbi:hypothetical protein ACN28E_09535 [Archangium lansingense]|uniref:hypothetical protein n=1 Tax=Archangium lansingense TaxID=2995310 RepID=UPI003B81F744